MDILSVPPIAESADPAKNERSAASHGFMLRVQAAIGPKQLDGRGLKGRVIVAFSLSGDGALEAVRITQSSGNDRLDRQALAIVSSATFPSPPPGLGVIHRTYVSAFTFA